MLVQFALIAFALSGLLALAVDIGFASLTQHQMQNAADSAALEGGLLLFAAFVVRSLAEDASAAAGASASTAATGG